MLKLNANAITTQPQFSLSQINESFNNLNKTDSPKQLNILSVPGDLFSNVTQ